MVLEEDGHVRRLVEEARMVERVQVLLADRAQEFLSEPLEDLQLAIIDGCDGVHPHFVHVTSSTRLRSHAWLAGWSARGGHAAGSSSSSLQVRPEPGDPPSTELGDWLGVAYVAGHGLHDAAGNPASARRTPGGAATRN
jgi:hypothetical protein